MKRIKVGLTGEKETLLVTLRARALESGMPGSVLKDRLAADVVRRLDYDFSRLKVGEDDAVALALRARALDRWTSDFLERHPEGATVLDLGCGLDGRVCRVDPPAAVAWFDVDYPDVIALRRRLFGAREGSTPVGSSVTDPAWLAAVPQDRPAIVVAEGLLAYLPEEEVPALLRRLVGHLPSGEIVFDAFSRLGLWLVAANPMIRATGARLRWSLDDPRDLEAQVPGLAFVEERAVFGPGDTWRLSPLTRFWVDSVGALPVLRRIGRLLRYRF